jgi:hypothetical protein
MNNPHWHWWARPSRAALFLLIPSYLLCAWASAGAYAAFGARANFLTGGPLWLGLAGLLIFSLTSALAEGLALPARSFSLPPAMLRRLILALFAVVIAAGLLFLAPAVTQPELLLRHLQGSFASVAELRLVLNRIPGVTSWMALQSLLIVLLTLYPRLGGQKPPRWFGGIAVALVALAALRAWLWSERLALLELAIPYALLRWGSVSAAQPWRRLAPLYGLAAVLVLFAAGEYFRSWQFYRYDGTGFLPFILGRFTAYYATALNNGAGYFTLLGPAGQPLATAEWFYRLPVWPWLGFNPWPADILLPPEYLARYANPEFTNMSGLFAPFNDFGTVPGLGLWALLGLSSGRLYAHFAAGRLTGLLLYPTWFIGIAEILRIFYWGNSRYFPVLAGALAVSILLTWSARQAAKA